MLCNILLRIHSLTLLLDTEKYSNPHQANNFLDVQVRVEDPDDHLPRDGAACVHGQPLDHRLLDAEAVREVRTYLYYP